MLEFWKGLFDSRDLAIVNLDSDGRLESWNPAAEKMYGSPLQAVRGRSISNVFQRLHTSQEFERAGVGLGRGGGKRILHKHGGRIWAQAPGADQVEL